jgi:zinc protease
MKKLLLLLWFSILLLTSPFALSAQYDQSGNLITWDEGGNLPVVYKLTNGLTVILYTDHSMPQVTGMVATLTGGKNDLPDATGMAHYMEHMLFKGTTKIGTMDWSAESVHIDRIYKLYDSLATIKDSEQRKVVQKMINEESLKAGEYAIPNELDRILKEMGSTNINAGTGPDHTVFYNVFPPHQIERWLEVYSHRFMAPVFRSFQSELEVVYEEKNMYSDMFFMNLFEEFNKNFYKVHPYGQQPLIGTMEHLKNPSLTKMKEFYDRWYVANNMALILAGDIDVATVMPLIQQTFGGLHSGKLPEKQTWVENPFNGREFAEVKMSPIKIGLLGFRVPPLGNPDQLLLEVAGRLLTNSNGIGLLDKLATDNKLLQAACQNVHYQDYGTGLIFFIPKITGQSLEDAEQLVLEQIQKLRRGEFSDTLLEAIKLNLYKEKVMELESASGVASKLVDVFSINGDYAQIWQNPVRVKEITRDEIIRVANEYYGDNFLAFYSKMGFPKKPKIEKPGFEPVKPKQEAVSEYYKMISSMPDRDPEYKFVDFHSDIMKYLCDNGTRIYSVENTCNDIFSLSIKYGIGTGKMPVLSYVAQMMNLAGTNELSMDAFKLRMAMLGCTYSVSADDSYLTIDLDGPEENLDAALGLISQLIHSPSLDQKKISTLYDGEKANRKMERSEPDMIADALVEYVLYGENSDYLDRLTMKQIKDLKADTLLAAFKKAIQYSPEIHYAGKKNVDEINMLAEQHHLSADQSLPSTAPFYRVPKLYLANGVYISHKKKAVQSKIFFNAPLEEFDPSKLAVYRSFNTYFGGDFSGIVLQEIREYRSMAYSAGGSLVQPPVKSNRMMLQGFVGTQSDKTNEAVNVFMDLVRNMPQKADRMTMIKRYIVSSTVTSRPGFRYLSQSYVGWVNKGYEKDPAAIILDGINRLGAADVFDYQKKNLRDAPVTIMIAGNAKRFDTKALAQYGKVTMIKEKNLFSK